MYKAGRRERPRQSKCCDSNLKSDGALTPGLDSTEE